MSATPSAAGSSLQSLTAAPKRPAISSARARVRLVTVRVAPCVRSVRAASSDIFPAPTTSTWRLSKPPNTWRTSSIATELTETGLRAIAVSRRTRRATRNALWKQALRMAPALPWRTALSCACLVCPRICGSPRTSESRLQATRKRWATASASRRS